MLHFDFKEMFKEFSFYWKQRLNYLNCGLFLFLGFQLIFFYQGNVIPSFLYQDYKRKPEFLQVLR